MSKIYTEINIVMAILIVTFSSVSVAETGKKPDPVSVSRGEKLYAQNCQVCHQSQGVGESAAPLSFRKPGFVPAMPLNGTSHAWHHGDKQMVRTILNGTPSTDRMPKWKDKLSVKDAQDVVSYIKTFWSDRIIACQGPKHMSCKPAKK